MRVALLALGSRGDVQPFVALGLALIARGHSVRLLAAADYEDLAEGAGLPYAAVGGRIAELMDFDATRDALDAAGGRLPLGFARSFVAQIEPVLIDMARDCLHACQGAELIVASTLGVYVGAQIAERLGLPLVPVHFHPTGASATYADMNFPAAPAWLPRGPYNRLSHLLAEHGLWQLLAGPLNRARREAVGLPGLSRAGLWRQARRRSPLALYAYSAALAPRPPDWPPWRVITGPWLLESPADYAPPAELARFLDAGDPPVYVGFGSILAGRDPAAITRLLVAALERAGRRGLLYRGAWGDLDAGELPASVLRVAELPHQWLFPRVAAVVTHGGAGTVTAALVAGAPPVVVPAFGDQRLWGRRVAELGAGPPPIPRGELNAERLAEAIERACADAAMRERAADLGRTILAENGAARAAELIERHAFELEESLP